MSHPGLGRSASRRGEVPLVQLLARRPARTARAPSPTCSYARSVDDPLFHDGDLRRALEAQAEKMREAVASEPEENVKQADVEQWAQALAHHFAVACPELKEDEIWQEPPQDTTIDVSRDQRRFFGSDCIPDVAYRFPGYRVVVHLPFDGDPDVFRFTPSTRSTVWPRGRVGRGELLFTIEWAHDEQPTIDATAQAAIASVARYLAWAHAEIENFNGGLVQQARLAIEARRQRLAQRDTGLAQSSIPVRRPGDNAKTYIADVLVRRPSPSLPQTRGDERRPQLEPELEERVFEHVLEVMRKVGLSIEQNPATYGSMGEEARRNAYLTALSTHYDGFSAETDNQGGHTDILARHEGRNVFIAECKFWGGEASFTATIDQLFSYTGWRDTKLAIVMFVRAKGLTAVLEKAREALAAHSQFVGWKQNASETELRATMRWLGDEARLADLNVFFVHTPAQTTSD